MNNDKKKPSDKKADQSKPSTKKKGNDKLKLEDDQADDSKQAKTNLNTISKPKKATNNAEVNTTPKATRKAPERKFPIAKGKKTPNLNEVVTPKNCSVISLTNTAGNSLVTSSSMSSSLTNSQKSQKETPTKTMKKMQWSQNPMTGSYLAALCAMYQSRERSHLMSVFEQLNLLKDIPFFEGLLEVKRKVDGLLASIAQGGAQSLRGFDGQKVLSSYIEALMDRIEVIDSTQESALCTQPPQQFQSIANDNSATLSDNEIAYLFKKSTSVSFEIPITQKRALSTRIENRLKSGRRSSEEISSSIQQKLAAAEQKKESMKKLQHDNFEKIKERINEIKRRQKKEKKEKMQKLYQKLEKMNLQQQKFLQDKIQVVKDEHEKVAEINYLRRLGKESRDLSILKKLDISIERRNKYLKDRVDKAANRKHPRNISDELKENLISRIDTSTSTALEAIDKKKQVEAKIDFMKKVYNENFIWELIEADYFDVNELYNLSSLTKFELMKSKLRKEKEIIDRRFEAHSREKRKMSKTSNCGSSLWNETFSSAAEQENKAEDALFDNSDMDESKDNTVSKGGQLKRSKSFTAFNEAELVEFDYLFMQTPGSKPKKKHKKSRTKKKKLKKEEGNAESQPLPITPPVDSQFKKKLLKTINSLSSSNLRVFYNKVSHDKQIKKILVKSKKDGKYIQSKLIISQEDNTPHQEDSNSNSHNSKEKSDENISSHTLKSNSSNQSPNKVLSEQADDKKEKIFTDIIQNPDLTSNTNTIVINSDSLINLLEKNQITVRWCKICNMILPNDQDSSTHISKPEHLRTKKEYGLSIQEEANTVMVFKSIPGDINEDLKNERVNAIKLRVKKLKQKMALKAVKHENFWNYKQDFPSINKQRILKLSFDIEKQAIPNIKDYEVLESLLKDLIKVLEQKKQNDLHILRQVKLIQCLVELLKKPAGCHKSEIKSLGKILELILKILLFFSSLHDNKNYMLVTNRISVVADLLLWVLNKPTKIPLGISFLPDLLQILIIHIKHRIPFEYLYMKDDTLEYIFLSNILIKFKQKYVNIIAPIDLTSGFGSFPFVLLKSLSMFESLTTQININYRTKPVYIKQNKISENILFILEYTELIGLVHLLTVLLLSNGPIKPKEKINVQPQTVVSASLIAIKVISNICRIDLNLVQNIINTPLMQEQMQHIASYIIIYSLEYLESSDDIKELLHETVILIGYLALMSESFQTILSRGEVTLLQHICSLPFSYFSDKQLKDILLPSLIAVSYGNERNTQIISNEINLELIVMFIKEKIQLEPILEEEFSEVSSSNNNESSIINTMMINKEQFLSGANDKAEKKLNGINISTASSTKSCHDMITGVSDFVLLYHRFPLDLWDKALEYYSTFGKKK